MAEETKKYSAFISYKHGDLDTFVAENLHKAIETFKVPRNIQKATGKKEIERVFRDKDELPISSNLSDNISQALQNSEYLIVICSPRTPESYWVQKEIETFIEMHDRDHVLAVLIEGEPEEAFPERLRYAETVQTLPDGTQQVERIPVEPLAADLRANGKPEVKKLLRTEILRIMAPLLGCGYDDLRQRHRERKMHRIIGISAGLSVCFLAFGLYSLYNTMQINRQYRIKQINQSRYLAETSQRLLNEGNRELAVRIAMEALPEYEGADDRPYVAEAEYALSEALGVYADGYSFRAERQLVCDAGLEEMVLSPDQSLLAARDSMQNIYVWRVEDFELLNRFQPEFAEAFEAVPLQGINFNENNQLVSISDNGMECRDVQTGDIIWETEGSSPRTIQFNRRQSLLLVDWGEELQVFDTATGQMTARTDAYTTQVHVAFSPDDRYVAYSTDLEGKNACVIWDMNSGSVNLIQNEAWENRTVSSIVFAGKENVIISCSGLLAESALTVAGNMTMYRAETLEPIWSNENYAHHMKCYYKGDDTEFNDPILVDISGTDVRRVDGATGAIDAISQAFYVEYVRPISESSYFVVGEDGETGLLDQNSGFVTLGTVAGASNMEDCISLGNTLLYRNKRDNKIMVASRLMGTNFQQCQEENFSSKSGVCTDDGSYMVIEGSDGLRILSLDTYEVVKEIPLSAGRYNSFRLYQDTSQLVYFDQDSGLYRYDLDSGTESERLDLTEKWVSSVVLSQDGSWFVMVEDEDVCVYDTNDFTQCRKLEDIHMDQVVIDNDGRYLAGRKEDGTLGIYELASGNEIELDMGPVGISEVKTADEIVIAAAHTRPWLAVSGADQQIYVIDMQSARTLCQLDISRADQSFLEFTLDDSMLMIADVDSAISFCDLQDFVITKQVPLEDNRIQGVRYLPEQELCILEVSGEAYLLTTKDNAYTRIAGVSNFLAMDGKTDRIYIDSLRNGFGYFQYQPLDALLTQGRELVKEEGLSELEKRTYNVE